MKMECVPIIKMQIEGMKIGIAQAMGIEGSDLEKVISKKADEEIKKMFSDESITILVRDILWTEVRLKVIQYFQYGKGAVKVDKLVNIVIKKT